MTPNRENDAEPVSIKKSEPGSKSTALAIIPRKLGTMNCFVL